MPGFSDEFMSELEAKKLIRRSYVQVHEAHANAQLKEIGGPLVLTPRLFCRTRISKGREGDDTAAARFRHTGRSHSASLTEVSRKQKKVAELNAAIAVEIARRPGSGLAEVSREHKKISYCHVATQIGVSRQ